MEYWGECMVDEEVGEEVKYDINTITSAIRFYMLDMNKTGEAIVIMDKDAPKDRKYLISHFQHRGTQEHRALIAYIAIEEAWQIMNRNIKQGKEVSKETKELLDNLKLHMVAWMKSMGMNEVKVDVEDKRTG